MMSVESRHQDYILMFEDVLLMRHAIRGQRAIKDEDHNFIYLPVPPALAVSWNTANRQRYIFYKSFAEFPELVGPTVLGLQGMVHQTEPIVELPAKMQYLFEQATPDGKSLQQLWQMVTSEIFSVGRIGLLPEVFPGDLNGINEPVLIAPYTRESMRNWLIQDIRVGPALVVLAEPVFKHDGRYGARRVKQYRVLEIDQAGKYIQSVVQVNDGKEVNEEPTVISRKGIDFNKVPLVVINTATQGFELDSIALLPMANKSIDVYRKKASYGRAMYNTSDPTPFATGVKQSELPETIGGGSMWSASSDKAKFGLLEVAGTGLEVQRKAIQDDLDEALANAGRILDHRKNQPEAGVSIKRQQAAQKITTVSIIVNAAQGMQDTLKNVAVFLGEDPAKIKFIPNLDFAEIKIEPQDLLGLMQAKNDGLPLSLESIHEILEQSKYTNKDFKTELAVIEKEPTQGEGDDVPQD